MEPRVVDIKPGRGMLAVVVDDAPETTPGGIVLPDNARDLFTKAPLATVIAVGDEVKEYSITDRVIVSGYDGHPCKVHGRDFRIVLEKDVLARVIG